MKKLLPTLALLVVIPTTLAAQGATEAQTRQSALGKQFIQWLRTGAFDSAAARAEPGAKKLSAEELEAIWTALTTKYGALQVIDIPKVTPRDTFMLVDMSGTFPKGNVMMRVALTAHDKVIGLYFLPYKEGYRVPPYVNKELFDEVPVTVGTAPWTLPGILTLPKGTDKVAAVVLVHGSGPHDKDATVEAQRPFRDIALGLASKNIAVLRYDKRTYKYAKSPEFKNITMEQEVIDDALLAIELLRSNPRIDPKRIYLVGHSLGASLAPEIAAKDKHLAGIGILAGNARKIDVVMREQFQFLKSVDTVFSGKTNTPYDSLMAVLDSLSAHKIAAEGSALGIPAQYFYAWMSRDPVATAKSLHIPMFIAGGGYDYQVPETDYKLWQAALSKRSNVTFHFYPQLNHLMIPTLGVKGPTDYKGRQRNVQVDLITDLADWIGRN